MDEAEQLTEFQIVWCVIMVIALSTVFMDVFKWRATPEICTRTYHELTLGE